MPDDEWLDTTNRAGDEWVDTTNRVVGKPRPPAGGFPNLQAFVGGAAKGAWNATIGAVPGLVSQLIGQSGQSLPVPPLSATGAPVGVPGGVMQVAENLLRSHMNAARKSWGGYIPFIGPPSVQAGEKIGTGFGRALAGDTEGYAQAGEGAGEAGSLLLPFAGRAAAGAIPEASRGVQQSLKRGAEESYSRALGATTQRNKALSSKVVSGTPGIPGVLPPTPGMIERGVWAFTRRGLQSKITAAVDSLGEEIGRLQAAIPEGTRAIPLGSVLDRINAGLNDQFTVTVGNRRIVASPDAKVGMSVASKLKDLLIDASFPDQTTGKLMVDYQVLRRFKQNWDEAIADAGGFANQDFVRNAKMGAYRESTNGIREQLNSATPDIAAINREYHFWKMGQDVIDATVERTKSQSQAMGQQMARVAGQAAGLAYGGVGRAIVTGETMRLFRKVTTSTGWNTVSAITKDRLANALASGNSKLANTILATEILRPTNQLPSPPKNQ